MKSILKIIPRWTEDEDPDSGEVSLRQSIANSFFEVGKHYGYQFLPSVSGALSTTFSYPVFALPHLEEPVRVHGFLSAFRPIDNDEGTHLVTFGQYYICTNIPFADRFQFIKDVLCRVIHASFPQDLGLTNLNIEEGCEDWKADSTGYRGGGSEINVTSITLGETEYKIGRLELAQINDYNFSGNIKGGPCQLIVFGIDRLTNLCALIKAVKERPGEDIARMPIHELYMMEEKEAALHKGLADLFRSTPANSDAILSSILGEISYVEQALAESEFTSDVFMRLGQASSLAECAYAANAITRNYRQYLIHKFSQLYAQFAKDIVDRPQVHLQTIKQLMITGKSISPCAPSIFDVLKQPFLKRHFNFSPRATERKVHEGLVPESLVNYFWDEEVIGGIKLPSSLLEELKKQSLSNTLAQNYQGSLHTLIRKEQRRVFSESGQTPDSFPQFLLKKQMFCRAVGEDLARPVEALAHPTNNTFTLAGSISDRLERLGLLLDYLKQAEPLKNTKIDCNILKQQIRYLAAEWQYRSIKIYPQLEGLLGAIAMQQQGYDEQLTKRIQAFHLAGTKRQISSHDPETLLLILVGKLDEAVSLFVRSTEDGRSASSFDPFGVRPKLSAAVEAAKKLGFGLGDIKALLCQIAAVNPDAIGNETGILDGYLWSRIEKAFSPAIQPKAGLVALKKIPGKSKSFFGLPKDTSIETHARRAN